MERFIKAETEQERKEKYEKMVKILMENGKLPVWKINSLLQENESEFGISNDFPKLSKQEEEKLDKRFNRREELIKKYKELSEELKPLLKIENEVWKELYSLNNSICEIEGHRLSDVFEVIEDDGYGRPERYYARECIICGKYITASTIKYNDVVVKNEKSPKRILYSEIKRK